MDAPGIGAGSRRQAARAAVLAITVPALALALALAAPITAAAEHGAGDAGRGPATEAKRKPVRVALLDRGQGSLLRRGARVEVGASERAAGRRVRVRLKSKTFDHPELAPLTEARRVRVRANRPRRVRLALTDAGRTAVARCGARALRIRTRSAVSAPVALKRDTPLCAPQPLDLSRAEHCDFIGQQQGSLCLLPFPDDYYTVADPTTATGRRIDLATEAMPANAAGAHIDADPYRLNDGFSPGQGIVLKVPGLDDPQALAATDATPLNHLGRYDEPDAPVVVIDAETGERWPIWVEIDSNAATPAATALEIHPATNFAAGHRYVVALRDLRRADGSRIPAPEGFRYYRDDLPSPEPAIEAQRGRFESIFRTLRRAGIKRSKLHLAWDFTVASDENIAGRMLHIRDDAFAGLGDMTMDDLTVQGAAPAFEVTQVDELTPAEDPRIAREVFGTYTVPCYLAPSCAPGGRFALDAGGLPTRNGSWTANFECIVPRIAVEGAPAPVRPAVYGHGLFGAAAEVRASIQRELAGDHGFVLCATDEIGMSSSDLPNTGAIVADLSDFPELADRLQQGLLDELFLGRLMIHPDGLGSDPAFRVDGTQATPSVIDGGRLYYNGNSQGGILGGALTAVAPDFERAAFGVGAMNYSVLLPRSIDYDPFAAILATTYPDQLAQPLLLGLIQMLWDRGEPNGYAHRMTDRPLPGTPAHEVLLQVALGDHQVSNYQSDVEARTIGAATHAPVLDPGRWPDYDVLWDVPRIDAYPFAGSAIVYGDIGPVRPDPGTPGATIGVPPPPLTNLPNRAGEDPHGAPRGVPDALQLVSDFLRPDGAVTDVCGAAPCYAGGWTGP